MTRVARNLCVGLAIVLATGALVSSSAQAQGPNVMISGTFGFGGGFSPYGGLGFSPYGGYGFSPYGGNGFGYGYPAFGGIGYGGFGGYPGLYGGFGYGPFNYSQQLFQQQASLTQQIYQQRQSMLIDQIRAAQGHLETLDGTKQKLFEQYLAKSDTEKAAVRGSLIRDYLNLDPAAREGWRRDTVVQIILGQDLQRLDGLVEFRALAELERSEFRLALLDKYRALAAADQQSWQNDGIIGAILGKDWWLK